MYDVFTLAIFFNTTFNKSVFDEYDFYAELPIRKTYIMLRRRVLHL
jgi:hypothetical protein